MAPDAGRVVRLYDPRRDPQDWVDLLGATDCAVFLQDPGDPSARYSCTVFARFDAAEAFCRTKVEASPQVRCEIYDCHGLSRPPLAVIVHPDAEAREESGGRPSRVRKAIALVALLAAIPLLWVGVRGSVSGDIAIFFAINCVVLALRFFYWDVGVRHREKERQKRVEEHYRLKP